MSWEDEFRGFFFGEGYLGITRSGTRNGRRRYKAAAQIALRIDDAAILRYFQEKLGGGIYSLYPKRGNPALQWKVYRLKEIGRILDILEGGEMPSKKRKEIAIVREYLDTWHKPGKEVGKDVYEQRERLYRESKRLHRFNPEVTDWN